jgi:hypothetical protein
MEEAIVQPTVGDGSARPVARNRILSARLSEGEYADLEKRAWGKGMTIGDWAREVLLNELRDADSREIQAHIFTELIAIELAVMNGLAPLLRGEKLSPEQVMKVFHDVQATKAKRAQEILSKRAKVGER